MFTADEILMLVWHYVYDVCLVIHHVLYENAVNFILENRTSNSPDLAVST
jgi:hypothetical protein